MAIFRSSRVAFNSETFIAFGFKNTDVLRGRKAILPFPASAMYKTLLRRARPCGLFKLPLISLTSTG